MRYCSPNPNLTVSSGCCRYLMLSSGAFCFSRRVCFAIVPQHELGKRGEYTVNRQRHPPSSNPRAQSPFLPPQNRLANVASHLSFCFVSQTSRSCSMDGGKLRESATHHESLIQDIAVDRAYLIDHLIYIVFGMVPSLS